MAHSLKHLVLALGLVGACAPQAPTQGDTQAEPVAQKQAAVAPPQAEGPSAAPKSATPALTRVASNEVCMVNNQHMGSVQIPVPVEGKTYYGCCKMCESRLQDDATSRMGVDPVSQQPVDKALAVIARNSAGKVVYFESEDTFQRYLASR